MKYKEWIQRLYQANKAGGMKLGLSNPQKLDQQLGFPSLQFPSVHIAGTNGKGSVTTKIAAGYKKAGAKVGLYTSPHISCFRERIRINDQMIPEEYVEELLPLIFGTNVAATFFELTTLLAFTYFAREKVDIAVIETGIGGRLDATNILHPLLSVITSISFDHMDTLGHTLEEIALEKAGIIKPFTPVVIGPKVPYKIMREKAAKSAAPLYCIKGAFNSYHAENNEVAKKSMEILGLPPLCIKEGLQAKPSCRMEYLPSKHVVMDVGHNPDGLNRLFDSLQDQFPGKKWRIVCGLSKNKDIASCVQVIKKHSRNIYVVCSTNERGMPSEELAHVFNYSEGNISPFASIEKGIRQAMHDRQDDEFVLICGTFFIMQEARRTLGIVETCDPFDLNESSSFRK